MGEYLKRALKADTRTSDAPVVVISADATPGQKERALALGAVAVLSKPLDVSMFVDTVSPFLLSLVNES